MGMELQLGVRLAEPFFNINNNNNHNHNNHNHNNNNNKVWSPECLDSDPFEACEALHED